jgi:hypothetical protein
LFNPENTPAQIRSVVLACKGKRLAEFCGAAAEIPDKRRGPSSTSRHERNAFDRLQGAKQHGMPYPFLAGHDIAAEVHAIYEVDIEVSPLPEHHIITICATAKRMAGRVQVTEIRLHLDDPAGKFFPSAPADEVQTEQLPGDLEGRLQVEGTGQTVWAHSPRSEGERKNTRRPARAGLLAVGGFARS